MRLLRFVLDLAGDKTAGARYGVVVLLASMTCMMPALANQAERSGLADFLDSIGGDLAPPDKWGSENVPLTRDRYELLGQRFVREKIPVDPDAVSARALALFSAECQAKGGTVKPQDGPVTTTFATRVLDGVPLRSPAKEQWRASVAVCSRDAETVMGGFVAIVHDTTGIARHGDVGSQILMRLVNLPTVTGINAYKPMRIASSASLARQAAAEWAAAERSKAARDARLKRFYEGLEIGTDTNCGTVIQLRGPMVEVAIPASLSSINGERTFWSKKDRLLPPDDSVCTYGM